MLGSTPSMQGVCWMSPGCATSCSNCSPPDGRTCPRPAEQVAIVTFIARMLPHAPPGALTWALLHVAGTFAAMALGHACNLGLADNWRLRWHVLELLTLCVRSCDLGLGGGICAAMHATIVQRHAQQQPAPSAAPGGGAWAAAFSAVRFVSASGAGHLALHMSVLRLPPG